MDEPKRVLIIDDDKHISELLRLYFEKDGFNVTAGYTGDTVFTARPSGKPRCHHSRFDASRYERFRCDTRA